MRLLRSPGQSRRAVPSVFVAAAAVSLALVLAGCSASRQSQDYQSYAGAPYPRVAAAVPSAAVRPAPVIEADGLPAQAAPRMRPRREADDPSEPFSPNYGPPPIGVERLRPAVPVVPPKEPVRQARMTHQEAEAIVAQAIAAHEVRGQ